MEASTFTCSICGEASRNICLFCTKDACSNHLCERCSLCSDCCTCEMPVFNEMLRSEGASWPQYGAISSDTGESAELSDTPETAPALFEPQA